MKSFDQAAQGDQTECPTPPTNQRAARALRSAMREKKKEEHEQRDDKRMPENWVCPPRPDPDSEIHYVNRQQILLARKDRPASVGSW